MKTDKDFSPISPAETRDLAFDYRNDVFPIEPAETLVSAVFDLTVDATDPGAMVDADPAERLVGDASIDANLNGDAALAAVQRVNGCIDGNTYVVRCLATTTRGQILELYARLRCRAAT